MTASSTIELPVESSVPVGPDWIFNRPTGPKDKQGVFDFRLINRQFLDNLSLIGEPRSPLPLRTLLPTNYAWVTPDNKQRIPVALCEFAAYKAALAYEDEGVIARNLGNARNFAFFDSNRKPTANVGKLDDIADTQGFGFTYDGMVFVVLRGTEVKKKADRLIDIENTLTDATREDAERIAKLQERYGPNVVNLLPEIEQWSGLHLDFAIAWGAIADQVAVFLGKVDPNNSMPIIFVGHSLGGALALVGASLQSKGRVGAVVTFGAPLVGDGDFKARYTELGLDPITLRFEAYGDSVPRIMRSWFYGLHLWLRTLILTLANPEPIKTSSKFKDVGTKWGFSDIPPLLRPMKL